MPTIAQTALADLDHELANTRMMLERYPDGKNDYTPHAKSWPMIRLAAHVATLCELGCLALTTDELDFASGTMPKPANPTDRASLLAAFDAVTGTVKRLIDEATDAAMREPWTLRSGSHVIFTMPRISVLRSFLINHLVHHRAQLTIYYRMCGVPVPGLYGPSADDA